MVMEITKRPGSSPLSKRAVQSEQKKRLILKVATEVFAERGFSETTISQISQKARIAEGSIYHYFENKEDLLFSIPEERMENFLSGLQESLEGVEGALNKIRKLIWYHLNFYEKNRDYVLILVQNIRLKPSFTSTRAYALIRDFSRLLVQLIQKGKKEGAIRKNVDSKLLRDAILGSIEHVTIRGSILGRLRKLTPAADPIYDFFVSGIRTHGGSVTLPLQQFLEMNPPSRGAFNNKEKWKPIHSSERREKCQGSSMFMGMCSTRKD